MSNNLRGAYYRPNCRKYYAYVSVNGVNIYLGAYDTEMEAHKVYLRERKKYPKRKRGGNRNQGKRIVHAGITYRSMGEMAAAFKTSRSLIHYYLKHDKPFAGEYIDIAI